MQMHRFKAFGPALMVVFGLMTFAAVGAQAENLTSATHVHGIYLVESSESLAEDAKSTGSQISVDGALLIPNKSAEIVCSTGLITEGLILNKFKDDNGTELLGGAAHATIEFKQCKVFKITSSHPYALEGELTACTNALLQPIIAKALVLVVKHNAKFYLVIEPLTNPLSGGSLALIHFEPSTCALPEDALVKGSIAVEIDTPNNQLEHKLKLNTSETLTSGPGTADVQTLLGAALTYGANAAFIRTEFKVTLTGTHVDRNWGVC
jgi:hypothetical protein